jgi:hypothetical protein
MGVLGKLFLFLSLCYEFLGRVTLPCSVYPSVDIQSEIPYSVYQITKVLCSFGNKSASLLFW